MEVTLGRQFSADLNRLVTSLKKWKTQLPPRLLRAHKRIGKRWHGEANKRVPVDEGTLSQRIIDNSFIDFRGHITTEVGSNVPHAVFVEFGTERIAGGQVKALGTGAEITDMESIKVWPAKMAGLEGFTVDEQGRLRNRGRFVKGATKEQMPWLRPAFMAIKPWAIGEITKAVRPLR